MFETFNVIFSSKGFILQLYEVRRTVERRKLSYELMSKRNLSALTDNQAASLAGEGDHVHEDGISAFIRRRVGGGRQCQ